MMTGMFFKKLYKYKKANGGAVAVEAAIVIPFILLPLFAGTIDIGGVISSGQSLTNSTRSGTQYLLNGGRNETELRSIVIDAFEGNIDTSNVTISTACACPNVGAIPNNEDAGNGAALEQSPYSTRAVSLNSIEQCSRTCGDGTTERVLTSISMTYRKAGLYKAYDMSKTISIRVK